MEHQYHNVLAVKSITAQADHLRCTRRSQPPAQSQLAARSVPRIKHAARSVQSLAAREVRSQMQIAVATLTQFARSRAQWMDYALQSPLRHMSTTEGAALARIAFRPTRTRTPARSRRALPRVRACATTHARVRGTHARTHTLRW